ncbi:MAG: hypothetical protein ACYCVN_12465 [Acidimicrobiales bacterium]
MIRRASTIMTCRHPRSPLRRRADDSGQQALLIVVSISIVMFLFSLVLVTQATQEAPIVNRSLINHAAYRALQAGVNQYLYAINQDPNGVTCTKPGAPACAYFAAQGFTFGQFNPVPNTPRGPTGISYTPSEWTAVGYPVLQQNTGTIQVAVVGAAGFANVASSIQYQTADITFKANNNFLLNVSWSQYNDEDPAISGSSCTPTGYLWGGGGNNCGYGDAGYINGYFPLYGPVFSDDEILVCNNPTATIDHITTAAPQLTYSAGGGCSNKVNYLHPSENLSINPYPQTPPTNINALDQPAKSQGCFYQGPTTITFNSGGGYTVSSPDTPWQANNGTTQTTYDGLSLSNNKSSCLPSTGTSGSVTGPANGVIYVHNLNSAACSSGKLPNGSAIASNPLTTAYDAHGFSYDGEGPQPNCEGDAIVHGQVNGAYTLATQNDINLDGNLTYANCPQLTASEQSSMNSATPLGPWPAAAQCSSISSSATNDILGLIATNFVSVNNPLQQSGPWWNPTITPVATCGTSGASAPPDCSNPNPIIMASILALNHTFSVPNYAQSPGYLGTIDFWGSLGEKYIDIEESGYGNGYGMSYNWDPRLSVLSPPDFFTPSTPSWITQSFSVTVGQCSLVWPIPASPTCPALP